MAPVTMSPSKHNKMPRTRVKSTGPPADEFPTPKAKRVKRETDDDKGESLRRGASPEVSRVNEGDNVPASSQTDLETVLPQVKTDQEAIEEYEAYKAGEAELSAEERLEKRTWVKGRSSIYVDAFNLALDQVLEEESHLFDCQEKELFRLWRALVYESQYLYVRLFLRKTSAWHRIGKLGYHSDIGDLEAAIKDLQQEKPLPPTSSQEENYAGERDRPASITLGESFSFAECSDDHISTLDEASGLLLLDELKGVAKEAKVQGKNKKDLLTALRASSGRQSGLHFGLKRSDTEETASDNPDLESESGRATPVRINRDAHFTRKILEQTGKCIRLSEAPLKLFERVHLVFYRSTEWTEKSLTTIILAKISRRNFPQYIVCRSSTIFSTRSLLLEFEASLRTQFQIDSLLEFNGTPARVTFEHVQTIAEEVYPRWAELVALEQQKEDSIYESGEGAYLRRFSPAWVYTRIVHKGLLPLARFKEHAREHEILCALLAQRLFHTARRGAWYTRKALLEEHHMHALNPSEGRSPEAQKKFWKRCALATCETGLQDRECHVIYHHDLQKRIAKLERQLHIPVREQHDFSHARLVTPIDRVVLGTRVERPPQARRGSDPPISTRGAKTIWLDTHALDIEDHDAECSVEAMCLSYYRALGWKGFHSEGGIIRTLFALLMYDILFTYVPNVFQTAYQTAPLDLFSDTFYTARLSLINARLAEISNGEAVEILQRVWEAEGERETSVVGLRWDYDLEDLKEIVRCFGGEQLAVLLRLMSQEYQIRGGGVPDLFLWRVRRGRAGETESEEEKEEEKGEVMFAEVKSENDRLSDTQRLWIHVLTGAGVEVELCKAVAEKTIERDGV